MIPRTILFASLLCLVPLAQAQQALDYAWLSFAQLTGQREDGSQASFGADAIRARAEVTTGRLTAAMQIDLGAPDLGNRVPGALANVIADLYVNYRLADRHTLRFGQFKTPLGMDFSVPGHSLDLTKRGMEAYLVLARDVGLMASGRIGASPFSYDVGVFNPPGRSRATDYDSSQVGEDSASAGRLRFDQGPWHAELATGRASSAGGPGTADYEVADAGLRFARERWTGKIEWIDGSGVLGDPTREQRVYYLHGAYWLREDIELVVRHYNGRSELAGIGTTLSNTFLGVSKHLRDLGRLRGRLQLNYVLAGGDEGSYTGLGGYPDDILLAQFQLYVEK